MKKIDTLKKNYEFKNVLNRGNFYCGKQIIIYITKNKKQKNLIGIAIQTKLGKATKRNRLKRLIRENYRILQEDLTIGYNIVFLWNKKTKVTSANFHYINEDMQTIFGKAGIMKKE